MLNHKTPKKVIIFANTSWNLVNFRGGLIKELVSSQYEVLAVAPKDEYSQAISSLGVKYKELNFAQKSLNPMKDLKLMIQLAILLVKEKPDFCLTFTIKPNIYTCLIARFMNVVVVPNIAGLGSIFAEPGLLNSLVGFLYKLALQNQKTVFFQNNEDMDIFCDRGIVSRKQCYRLPGSGVDLKRFHYVPVEDKKRKQETKFILISRLLWSKGIRHYVDAAIRIKDIYPLVEFQILGFLDINITPDSVANNDIEDWSKAGVIKYLGETDDVKPFIVASDCVVLPTFYREGVPKSLLEAAAIGRPIITSNSVGSRDIVEHNENGYLVEPKNTEDLVNKLEMFLGLNFEQRRRMGSVGRFKVEKEFDEQLVVSKYLEVIG